MNDNEVYDRVIRRELSPDQLDDWYMGIPGTPSKYQMYLFAEGRAFLLMQSRPLAREMTLQEPYTQLQRIRVRTDHVPPPLVGHLQATVTGRDTCMTWMVPAHLREGLVATLKEQGYDVVDCKQPTVMTYVYVEGDSGSAVMSGRHEYPAPAGWRCWTVPAAEVGPILKQLWSAGYIATLAVPTTLSSSIDIVEEKNGRAQLVYGRVPTTPFRTSLPNTASKGLLGLLGFGRKARKDP